MSISKALQLQYLLSGSNKQQDISTKMYLLQKQLYENTLDIDSNIEKSGLEIASKLEKAIQDSLNR
ncbi:hypothetical protein [Intestinimonas butyriciproducens]|uniref:hypothetical protein n=1 Tax=Intestinimonas butyriciproducens TaxID=1297617 RepID=UPI0012E0B372|nr:hypothetical protein [Intestinimonas butyriciproducens]